ncbi:hypothetical protein [Paenirhodobacter sp.]|uniref:hypothetical protein n=1 Tax=Paenirhodobacter sp. TaxID=1965326 RepID=UPI003B3CCCFD
MAQVANWQQFGKVIPLGNEPVSDVQADLAQVEQACREIGFSAQAEAMARFRVVGLRAAVVGCRAEIARRPEASELRLAATALEAELASFEETLPMECAYRADQRDMALARLGGAQARLRARLRSEDDETRLRVQAALALSPELLVRVSQEQAVAEL